MENLLRKCVPALLGQVGEVQHGRLEMREGGDGLHLDRVSLLETVVQNTGRVDHLKRDCGEWNAKLCLRFRSTARTHLPAQVAVVHVTNKQRLRCECVRLNIDVRSRDLKQK